MNAAAVQLEAGGLAPPDATADAGATEQVVARTYRHPALGERPVVRLTSERLGQAEDLAMEFLGFAAPEVSAPLALQQRRSLGFAAWALTNDPKNARYALDLVKRMKAAARQARSKPGHAWDVYLAMAKDLGRSARHFLPPFWEEVGRAFKDLGNQTYAGRALNKSLEAERVHALESDRARRRDVVLEFVLAGCLSGNALSDYANDLQSHYPPQEAFAIFRDLCVRRTQGGMSPWATMPRDFLKLAKAAGLDADRELETWLEEVIEAPAMARPPLQFWKTCGAHCKRVVARNPAFAVALLRHTRPEPRYYGESKLGPWFELLEEWGVFPYLWEDEHQGAPPLGEPVAHWFGRIVRDEVPAPKRSLELLDKLTPRLKKENTPLPLSAGTRYGGATGVDIDVLEACLARGIKVADPPAGFAVEFSAWLAANPDHPLRNQDLVASWKDERFKPAVFEAMNGALACRGGVLQRGYRQANLEQRPFPLAAGDRPGIKELWRLYTSEVIRRLERAGLASFEEARAQLESTLWPDTLRLFPDLAERLQAVDPAAMLRRTLQAGVFDEYGWPALEQAVDQANIKIEVNRYGNANLHLTFPSFVLTDKVHAYVIAGDGQIKKHELRLPKKCEVMDMVVVGDDLAVSYRDNNYRNRLYWVSDPAQHHDIGYGCYHSGAPRVATALPDGSVFLGQQAVRPGDKQIPSSPSYFHDGQRFWRPGGEYDPATDDYHQKVQEVDPQTGKPVRESVPPWFEETEGGTVEFDLSELMPAPPGAAESPLGVKDGMLGWKVIKRGDDSQSGVGIDGRRWDRPGMPAPVGLLRQPGTEDYLPVTTAGGSRAGNYALWDPSGSTMIAQLHDFSPDYAYGQAALLPLTYWHLLKVRDEGSSRKLRAISSEECAALLQAAAEDRAQRGPASRGRGADEAESPLTNLLPAVKKLLPTAPERMALGIARVIERAEGEAAALAALRNKVRADSRRGTTSAALAAYRKTDQAAAPWGLQTIYTYGNAGDVSVSEHLTAAAAFLKDESAAGELPRTNYLWFAMLEDLPLRAWQTFWRALALKMAQKDNREVPWLEFLKHWQQLGIAELPGQFALMEGRPEGAKRNAWGGYDEDAHSGKSFALQNGDDRFIAIGNDYFGDNQFPYQFLRYSTSQTPGAPPGYEVKKVRKVKAEYDPAEVAAFVAAAESCTAPPLPTPDELAELAGKLAASPVELGLIWMGGLNLDTYQANFLPAELRKALGCKATEAAAGRQALRNLNASVRDHLYEAVVAPGCAAPFAVDRGPVLRSLEKVWKARMPRRLPLDAALQRRLSALGRTSRWHQLSHEELLAVAAEPAKHPLLQPREIEIKADKSRGYNSLCLGVKGKTEQADPGALLRSILQLVGLVHAETPAGHPARADMPALIKQATKLLDHPGTLFDLRSVYLYAYDGKKTPKPTEWLTKHLGKTKANAQDGTARFDDGLLVAAGLDSQYQVFVAFRPARLKSQADLARLRGILVIDAGEEDVYPDVMLPLVVAIKGPGFQKLAGAVLARGVPAGQWPQNPLHTAPAVVKAVQKKLKLGEDAAVLYAQLLALPDPTAANVRAWNGWTAAQLKEASQELVGRKLVLEAVRARAGRSVFLPGEWAELKAPWLPVETWKLAHLTELDMDPHEPCPAGGPMVLRPFEDLFAAAWQRVLDGDEPRYEEVKRKKKSK